MARALVKRCCTSVLVFMLMALCATNGFSQQVTTIKRAPLILGPTIYVYVDNGLFTQGYPAKAQADAQFQANAIAFWSSHCSTSNWNFVDTVTPYLAKAAPAGSENAYIDNSDGSRDYYSLGTEYERFVTNAGTYMVTSIDPNYQGCPITGLTTGTLTIGDLEGTMDVVCPTGWSPSIVCEKDASTPDVDKSRCSCNSLESPTINDPVNIANFMVSRTDTDVSLSPGLEFTRYYSSSNYSYGAATYTGIGQGWQYTYSSNVKMVQATGVTDAYVTRPNGQILTFTPPASGGRWVSDSDIFSVLTELTNSDGSVSGWTYLDANTRNLETYDAKGELKTIALPGGRTIYLTYSGSDQLVEVNDDFGRYLTLVYDTSGGSSNGLITSVSDQAGSTWRYAYDGNGHLVSVTNPDGTGLVYGYYYNNLSEVGTTDAQGNESDFLWFTYGDFNDNSSTYNVSSTYEAGNVNKATFTDEGGGVVEVDEPLSANTTRTRTYTFSLQAQVLKLASVQGGCTLETCGASLVSYNASGLVSTTSDFNGNQSSITYDASGLPSQTVLAAGSANQRTTSTSWNDAIRLPLEIKEQDAEGNLVLDHVWTYNQNGQVLTDCQVDVVSSNATASDCAIATPPSGIRKTTYSYCTAVDGSQCPLTGLQLAKTGPRHDVNQTTSYSYYLTSSTTGCGTPGEACHQKGDIQQIIDPLGHTTTFVSYDADGRPTRIMDANGVNIDMTYTPRGLIASRSVNGASTQFVYTPFESVQSVMDPDGIVTTFGYDGAHRLTKITDALGNFIQYTLDGLGNKVGESVYDSNGTLRKSIARTFNSLSQLTAVTDGLGHTVFNASFSDSYDANGNLVHMADGLGIQRKQSYDALNRLVSTLDNYNGTDTATQNAQTTLAYDALDNLEGVTDPDGLSTTYDYDGLSNPKALHSPDTGTASFQVDAAGNRIQQTDAKGIVRTTSYDALNRPVTVSYPDGTQNIAYHYDEADSVTGCTGSFPVGRLTRIVETAVTTTYCYDSHGNVSRKTQAQGSQVDTTSYSYTAANRLSSFTTPSNTVTQYSRDAAGRISGVTVTPNGGTGQTVVSAISYLPFGPISSYTLGNGQTVTRSYDASYQLTDLTSPALNLHFARDAMGNITGLSSTAGGSPVETYGYDPLYRLAAVNDATGAAIEAYTYSKTGDRLSKIKTGGLATGTYGYQSGTHWLTSIGSAARSYDLNGNTTGNSSAGETLGYGYNDRNRLTVVQRNQQTVATYAYNAMGERVAKAATSPQAVNERFAYNQASQLVGEYGTANRDYIWLGNLPIAVVDNGATSTISYVHADELGTPRAISDAAGNTIWQWAYQSNPFGEQQPTGSYVYNLRFPGQYFDAESGLHYNVNRNYEAAIGRYVQSDPIGLGGGSNTYTYVTNQPLGYLDRSGRQSEPAEDISERDRKELQNEFAPLLGPNVNASPVQLEFEQEHLGQDCAAPGTNRTILFRSVLADELDDIMSTGKFRNPYGIESKYFSETAEGAAQHARDYYRSRPDQGPYTIVQTSIDTSDITPDMRPDYVDRGIPTVVIWNPGLPGLTPPVMLNLSPIPSR